MKRPLFYILPSGLRIILCVRGNHITEPTWVGLGPIEPGAREPSPEELLGHQASQAHGVKYKRISETHEGQSKLFCLYIYIYICIYRHAQIYRERDIEFHDTHVSDNDDNSKVDTTHDKMNHRHDSSHTSDSNNYSCSRLLALC